MGRIKAGTIIATGLIGGAIGVAIAAVGKGIGNKTVGQIGDGVAESSVLTGEIVGDTIEGVADTAVGIAKKSEQKKADGIDKLKTAGTRAVGNFKENIVTMAGATKDVAVKAAQGDKAGVKRAAKNLFKIVSVGMITVGAVKVDTEEEPVEEEDSQKK